MREMIIAVAPNGATKQKTDHIEIPLTPSELAKCAKECLLAGATMMHVHVRDIQPSATNNNFAKHSIDTDLYKEAFNAIIEQVGDKLFLQATTESAGLFSYKQQIQAIYALKSIVVNSKIGISISISEICNTSIHDSEINHLFSFMAESNILPQLICYNTNDLKRLQQLVKQKVLPYNTYPCLFVLGRYSGKNLAKPIDLLPFLSALDDNNSGVSSWMVCGFGENEHLIANMAALLGGNVRIGFENNLSLMDKSIAKTNAELISQTANLLINYSRKPASIETTRKLMTPI